jgi:hypothetical protein
VTSTLPFIPPLPRLDLARRRDSLRRAASRAHENGERHAYSAARVLSDYWHESPARERDRLAPTVLDLLVLQAALLVGSGAFALALKLAPGAEGMLFLLYALGLVAFSALGLELLVRLAKQGGAIPTTALAARAPGRRRRITRARLRWLRRLLKRTTSEPPRPMRPSLA